MHSLLRKFSGHTILLINFKIGHLMKNRKMSGNYERKSKKSGKFLKFHDLKVLYNFSVRLNIFQVREKSKNS